MIWSSCWGDDALNGIADIMGSFENMNAREGQRKRYIKSTWKVNRPHVCTVHKCSIEGFNTMQVINH